jgi:hypothetical protein
MSGHLLEIQARRLLKMPEDWLAHKWEKVGNGFLVSGCVCTEVYKRGPRKGQPNFSKRDKTTDMVAVISYEAADAFRLEWEQETELCSRCMGKKQIVNAWHHINGTTYRDCPRCKGTGQAPVSEEAA